MQGSSSTSAMLVTSSQHEKTLPHFQGHTLLIMRLAWVLLVTLFLCTFVIAIPAEYAHLSASPPAIRASLLQLGLPLSFYTIYQVALEIISIAIYSGIGILIFWHKSDEVIGLFVSFFLLAFSIASTPTIYALEASSPLWSTIVPGINALGWGMLAPFFYLFPDGRFVPRWTRWMALVSLVYQAFWIVPDSSLLSTRHWPVWLFLAVELSLGGTCIGSQLYRYFRISSRLQRQQTSLVVWSILVPLSVYLISILLGSGVPTGSDASPFLNMLILPALLHLASLLIPLSLGVAILRHRLWDIDLIVNRTLVYSALTISTVGIYILAVSALGALFQARGNFFISLLATGVVAVLFQPLRDRIQRSINRSMYGERDTPNKVLSRLGQRLETTLAPDAVLPTIVETVAQALKLPYTAITLKQGQGGAFVPTASYGQASKEEPVRFPLVHQNEQIGELLLAPRAPGETFTHADRALLSDLARQAGIAAHAVRLTIDLQQLASELQHSRTQLVTTREEERRRLRRDLHDGLGPALGSLPLQLDTARNLYKSDPPAADALLVDLKAQVQSAIADIRRLVYELRPPTLDELGLVSALREQVTRYRKPDLSITLNAPEQLPPLPAAVEVVIYRIAQEALTNMVRHAHAQRCSLSLEVTNCVCLEVRDDGQGLPADYRIGVGLTSMRERAAELGGTCAIEPVEAGGTRVLVQLPLPEEEAHARAYPRADR
ncbi:MAG: hypothetical protein JOZ18_09715 [Chloroflexi bacterium]|nr:hypothetical protein [Chloroflexota bacterium]